MPQPSTPMPTTSPKLQAMLLGDLERSAADRKRILRERAQRLAQVVEEVAVVVDEIEVVVVFVGARRFAVECPAVRESCALRELTPVPCTPDHVVGIVNFRGEIIPVVDLELLLDLPRSERGRGQFLVVDSEVGPVGLLIDTIGEVHEVPPATAAAASTPFVKGYVLDQVGLLDIPLLVESTCMRDEAAVELAGE